MTKLKLDAEIIAEDNTNDLLLIAYDGRLYVQATPDGKPLAIFDAADVLSAIGAEQTNRQALIAVAVHERGYTQGRFGSPQAFLAAQTIKTAEEALETLLLVLPTSPIAQATRDLCSRFKLLFDIMATGQPITLLNFDPAQLAAERADIMVTLATAAEASRQDLLDDALAKAKADISRGVTDLAGREKPSC